MASLNITQVTVRDQQVTRQVAISEKSQGQLGLFLAGIGASLAGFRQDTLVYSPERGELVYTVAAANQAFQVVGKAFSSIYHDLVKRAPVLVHNQAEMDRTTRAAAEVYQKIVHPKLSPGCAGGAIIMAAGVADGLSVLRNACGVQIGWDQAVRHMGVGGGTLSLGLSALELHNARKERESAIATQNNEVRQKATAKIAGATVGVIASLFYILGKANELSWIVLSVGAVTAITVACTTLWGIGAIISIALTSLGIHRCRTFEKRLSDFGSDEAGLKNALSYLLSEITVSPAEIKALRKELESKGEHTELELQAKVAELEARKIKYVKTRTSLNAVRMILDRAPEILNAFNRPNLFQGERADLCIDARLLLVDVRHEGYKKKLVYTISLIAAIIGLTGVILGCFASMGVLPLILFAGSAAIGLGLTIANSMAHLQDSKKARPRFHLIS
jgi:hypothetical protein